MKDFVEPQVEGGHISYNSKVVRVEKVSDGVFEVESEQKGRASPVINTCEVVVMSNGISTPNVPKVRGWDLTEGYEGVPETGKKYEGKTVAVFGMGNAGSETANALAPYVNFVHLFPGRSNITYPIPSWETRYVGSLRAIRDDILVCAISVQYRYHAYSLFVMC
jgi:cation diffusion facilitator CzcD-associated flavoprotein CzcO